MPVSPDAVPLPASATHVEVVPDSSYEAPEAGGGGGGKKGKGKAKPKAKGKKGKVRASDGTCGRVEGNKHYTRPPLR